MAGDSGRRRTGNRSSRRLGAVGEHSVWTGVGDPWVGCLRSQACWCRDPRWENSKLDEKMPARVPVFYGDPGRCDLCATGRAFLYPDGFGLRRAAHNRKPSKGLRGSDVSGPLAISRAFMKIEDARIVYLTAGAAGMFCGSCMRDNALAKEMQRRGIDVMLLPLYTPIRTDETDVSVERVFFGGINVYLQQKIPLFRHLPRFLDRWLDHPWLIKRLASSSVKVDAKELGELTLSMVRGESGYQRKEVGKLVAWLKESARPHLVCLTNLLIGGCAGAIKRELGVPVLVTLQGDDLFLDDLPDSHRDRIIEEMRKIAQGVDGFIVFNDFYADKMSKLLEVPIERFHKTALGIQLEDFELQVAHKDEGKTLGYFARVSPEKGFHNMVDAFIRLRAQPGLENVRLKAGGWLSDKDRPFFDAEIARIKAAGLIDSFEYVGAPEREEKLAFFQSVDVFSVPASYADPKGMSVLEAMACGLPVVQPAHGAFDEILRLSGGGIAFPAGDIEALTAALAELLSFPDRRRELGERGREWVWSSCGVDAMAETSAAVFAKFL